MSDLADSNNEFSTTNQYEGSAAQTPSLQDANSDADQSDSVKTRDLSLFKTQNGQLASASGLSDDKARHLFPAMTDNLYDERLAGPEDNGEFSLIGNPANPRLRKEWSQKWGLPWPQDPVTGRNYDVAHIVAKGDGGKDHVDNIRPMHPEDHIAEHIANGDMSRWGMRPGIARAFGGTVARSLGPLSILSDILGMMSGRIRTDNLDNFSSDMIGVPSQEDRQKAFEDQQKSINPNWKRGDPYVLEL